MPLSGPLHFQSSAGIEHRGADGDGPRADGSYLDHEFGAYVVPVVLGHHRISGRDDDMLVTTLGSCVAACINDPVARIGGMNHFLLPGSPSGGEGYGVATRYGSVAMERLINDLLARGARRERMEVKLFGAARVIDTSLDVGAANAAFAVDYVRREGLGLAVQDLGGDKGRRVHFFPATGRAFRRLLRPEAERETVHQEMDYLQALRLAPLEGEVELFERR
ncbi:chemotaxis protein [Azospirillum sp. YIM DDC1]|uniref:Probable chemoreceptor glutamine deamidase CheD n=1 Tax=Azospirillum aestuarii TaxID=2802052 RepID=A0ABS1I6E5_9PROT|nr:chemotaxis protein [Azospirillum aestuarii]MBK4722639.1 chemotaxis protein [Azospirillum aestuarii]TWA84577.1 chemotaxis protein CheD [Azospirillum brasilense]